MEWDESLGLRVRPGDSWVDLLEFSVLKEFPTTNLPADVAAVLQEPIVRVLSRQAGSWGSVQSLPRGRHDASEEWSKRAVYRCRQPTSSSVSGSPRRVLQDGRELSLWSLDKEPYPESGAEIAWSDRIRALYTMGEVGHEPAPLDVEYAVQSTALFGDLELRQPIGEGPDVPTHPAPVATQLLRNDELNGSVVNGIRLPAGASLSLDVQRLDADRLSLAVGVHDRSYAISSDGGLVPTDSGSDGMRFVLEVREGAETEAAWSFELSAEKVGGGFQRQVADLSDWMGRAVTLTLRAEPLESADYDYGVLGSLYFYGPTTKPVERPHVVLIDIDTLRADRLDLYGYERATSPRLTEWASKDTVVYENTSSTATWTLPSTVSILSGLAVHQHQVYGYSQTVPKGLPTLPTLLKAHDYETAGFTGGAFLKPHFGLARGFDDYRSGAAEHRGRLWKAALDFLAVRESERPLFLFLHTYRVHTPYKWNTHFVDPDYDGPLLGKDVDDSRHLQPYLEGKVEYGEEDLRVISDLYDGEILGLDRQLSVFLRDLEAQMSGEPYLLLITSDHGEEFKEHGSLGHGHSLFQELTHVPLIVRYPPRDGERPSGRVSAPTSTLDIVPTILVEAGLPIPPGMAGRSLREALPTDFPQVCQQSREYRSIRVGDLKMMKGRSTQKWVPHTDGFALFDLSSDPEEVRDLSVTRDEELQTLLRKLEQYDEATPPFTDLEFASSEEMSEELRAKLEAMGYVERSDPGARKKRRKEDG